MNEIGPNWYTLPLTEKATGIIITSGKWHFLMRLITFRRTIWQRSPTMPSSWKRTHPRTKWRFSKTARGAAYMESNAGSRTAAAIQEDIRDGRNNGELLSEALWTGCAMR